MIDNLFVLLILGGLEAEIDDPLGIAGGFVVAYPFAFLPTADMTARGRVTHLCTSKRATSTHGR